jgi:hypothetical protein
MVERARADKEHGVLSIETSDFHLGAWPIRVKKWPALSN